MTVHDYRNPEVIAEQRLERIEISLALLGAVEGSAIAVLPLLVRAREEFTHKGKTYTPDDLAIIDAADFKKLPVGLRRLAVEGDEFWIEAHNSERRDEQRRKELREAEERATRQRYADDLAERIAKPQWVETPESRALRAPPWAKP